MLTHETSYVRNPATSIMLCHDEAIAILSNGGVFCIKNHTEQLSRLFALLRKPCSLSEIASGLCVSSDYAGQLMEKLMESSIVVTRDEASIGRMLSRTTESQRPPCKCLVIGISGTFQIIGSSFLNMISRLKGTFAEEVHVVLTKGATKFIKPSIFEYYNLQVWDDAFRTRQGANVPHMWLASHADLIFVAATANTLHRFAVGACSDLLSLVISATAAPIIVAPAMNPRMLSSPAIARNIDLLRRDGMYVAEPGLGRELSNTSEESALFGALGIPFSGLIPMLSAAMVRRAARVAEAHNT